MIVPVWWRVEGLTPSSNIGCRLIMFATPLLLETTAVGRVQNPAYRVSGNKNRAIGAFFIESSKSNCHPGHRAGIQVYKKARAHYARHYYDLDPGSSPG